MVRSYRISLAVMSLALALSAAPALAQPAAPPADDAAKMEAFTAAYEEGMKAIEAGKFDEGIAAFKKAIEANPDDPNPYYNVGCCYARLGKKPEAIDWLKKSAEKGFADVEHMGKDTDLDGLREEAGYKELVAGVTAAAAGDAPSGALAYEVVVGKDHDKTKATPLILALHGNGGDPKSFARVWKDLADSARVIVVCPQGPNPTGTGGFTWEGTTPDQLLEVVGKIGEEYELDEDRVIVAGYSLGAAAALRVAFEDSNTYAGVLAIAGDWNSESFKTRLESAKQNGLAVALLAGEKDQKYIAQLRQAKKDLEAAGIPLFYKEYPIGHELPPNTADEISAAYKWMAALPRPKHEATPEGGGHDDAGPKAPAKDDKGGAQPPAPGK
ncbi:MAG: alpha/beta fold hydrolase [Planctomycetes bacterium]|nr:alpha/beta fold hydrolase [Planctomycetota bacterium]